MQVAGGSQAACRVALAMFVAPARWWILMARFLIVAITWGPMRCGSGYDPRRA